MSRGVRAVIVRAHPRGWLVSLATRSYASDIGLLSSLKKQHHTAALPHAVGKNRSDRRQGRFLHVVQGRFSSTFERHERRRLLYMMQLQKRFSRQETRVETQNAEKTCCSSEKVCLECG